MPNLNEYITVIFYIFFVSVGLIFFFSFTLRYMRTANKFDLFLIFLLLFAGTIYLVGILTANRNYADSRNTQRATDIEIISLAVQEYLRDFRNKLVELGDIPNCPEVNYIGSDRGLVDLYSGLKEISLPVLPVDPTNGSQGNSGYAICYTSSSRIIISAPHAENEKIIEVKK